MGRNPSSQPWKATLHSGCCLCSSCMKDFPSSRAMPLMSSSQGAWAFSCLLEFHILRREDLCVSVCALVCFPPSYLLIILGRARQGDRSGCLLWYKARCFSVCSPKLCEYSALKYSLPLWLQTISCPKGLHGPPWPNIHIPLTATESAEEGRRKRAKVYKPSQIPHVWEMVLFLQTIVIFGTQDYCKK